MSCSEQELVSHVHVQYVPHLHIFVFRSEFTKHIHDLRARRGGKLSGMTMSQIVQDVSDRLRHLRSPPLPWNANVNANPVRITSRIHVCPYFCLC